jgi:hypothetical protein
MRGHFAVDRRWVAKIRAKDNFHIEAERLAADLATIAPPVAA